MTFKDVENRDEYESRGLLRSDSLDDLKVYTYTRKVEYDKLWDEFTLNSRGHIFNICTGECVARPFSKFFNIGQRDCQPDLWQPCQVFEKMDGWLATLYRYNNQFRIATRGSFKSEGAILASKHLNKHHDLSGLPDETTLVFEIISPTTRIIVDYKGETKLILLAAFNRITGEEYNWDQVCQWADQFGFDIPKVYNGWNAFNAVIAAKTLNPINNEGFVLKFENGQRLKVKGDQYVALASCLKQLSPLSLWKNMFDSRVKEEFLTIFDEPWLTEAKKMAKILGEQYDKFWDFLHKIEYPRVYDFVLTTTEEWDQINVQEHRKRFAKATKESKTEHVPAMFLIYDDNDVANEHIDQYVMKHIRPKKRTIE